MAMDFWGSRVHSSKHLPAAAHHHSSDTLVMDDSEGDEDSRVCFVCPFCYVDIEISMLSSHLQDEHCFDVKTEVCPVCAGNLGKDVTTHFMLQHSHSLKQRRRPQRSGFRMNSSTIPGRELRDLTSSLDSPTISRRGNQNEPATDPLLSPFLCSMPLLDHEIVKKEKVSATGPSTPTIFKRIEPQSPDEEQDFEEKNQRAAFFQQLVCSTIF